MVNIQASLPPGSRPAYPYVQQIKQRGQDTCMDEWGASIKSQMDGRNLWNVGKGTSHIGGLEEHHSLQG